MILGEYLQMKYGTQKKKQLTMPREINLKNMLSGKLYPMIINTLNYND